MKHPFRKTVFNLILKRKDKRSVYKVTLVRDRYKLAYKIFWSVRVENSMLTKTCNLNLHCLIYYLSKFTYVTNQAL